MSAVPGVLNLMRAGRAKQDGENNKDRYPRCIVGHANQWRNIEPRVPAWLPGDGRSNHKSSRLPYVSCIRRLSYAFIVKKGQLHFEPNL